MNKSRIRILTNNRYKALHYKKLGPFYWPINKRPANKNLNIYFLMTNLSLNPIYE